MTGTEISASTNQYTEPNTPGTARAVLGNILDTPGTERKLSALELRKASTFNDFLSTPRP